VPEYDAEAIERVARIKREVTERLLALPGVNLVSIGRKETGGESTGELAIQIWVDEKLPMSAIPAEQRIPAEIDGVPTDVYVGGRMKPLAAPGAFVGTDTDGTRYRPPVPGGSRIHAEGLPEGNHGTMGCILHDPADTAIAYGLTCYHVIQPDGTRTPTAGSTRVGQPSNESSSTACCDDIIGTYAGGARVAPIRDEALIRLSPGVKYVFDIVDIGFIEGPYTLTLLDAAVDYPVRKRGIRTRVTGGIVISVDGNGTGAEDLIIIRPNSVPGEQAGNIVFFAAEGDSGSALVVDGTLPGSCKVAGLIRSRMPTRAELQAQGLPVPPLPADGIERIHAYAMPIVKVLERFADDANENIDVVVPSATQKGQVHTVPGGSIVAVPAEVAERITADTADRGAFVGDEAADGGLRAPVGRAWFAEGRPRDADLAALREGLDATVTGRLLITFWLDHQDELNRLVRADRRVAIVWHRGGGAAIMQLFVRMVGRPELALPETVGGRPLLDCLDELIAVLAARGSARLRADMERVRRVLPDVGGRTLPEIMFALGASPLEVGGDG
jgi:hypothetical protein